MARAKWTPEQAITLFCQAAVRGLIDQEDLDYSINLVLDQMRLDMPQGGSFADAHPGYCRLSGQPGGAARSV